jgi:hypothetical protein
MRIIKLVTLLFLPGTFDSVLDQHIACYCQFTGKLDQTFMSTDVRHWESGRRQYESGALATYFALTLPMTAFISGMWY